MILVNRIVETERQINEKIVRRFQQIYERSVQIDERKRQNVEMERQMNEKIVRIVHKMYESVQHSVEMERFRKQRHVRIVRKMYENVVRHVEMERYSQQKIVRIVQKMYHYVEVVHVEMESQTRRLGRNVIIEQRMERIRNVQ